MRSVKNALLEAGSIILRLENRHTRRFDRRVGRFFDRNDWAGPAFMVLMVAGCVAAAAGLVIRNGALTDDTVDRVGALLLVILAAWLPLAYLRGIRYRRELETGTASAGADSAPASEWPDPRSEHRIAVYDTRPRRGEKQFDPYFVAICSCGWVGEALDTEEEARIDAAGHDINVLERVLRPLG